MIGDTLPCGYLWADAAGSMHWCGLTAAHYGPHLCGAASPDGATAEPSEVD